MTLAQHLILAKNKTGDSDPWIALLKITLNDVGNTIFKLANNTENIWFNDGDGNEEYIAFPFNLQVTRTSGNEIPQLELEVSNITRLIQPYLEDLDGAINSIVKISLVHVNSITTNVIGKVADYADLIQTYDVIGTQCNSNWVKFILGSPSPLRQPFPPNKYLAQHCAWQFDTATTPSPECNYRINGDGFGKTVCKRTFEDCTAHSNEERFGGFFGLQTGGIRIV